MNRVENHLRLKIIRELHSAEGWIFSSYRNCYMLPVYTSKGRTTVEKIKNLSGNLDYTAQVLKFDHLKYFIETHVFSSLGKGRIMILRTEKFSRNKIHIDCSPSQYQRKMFKYRFVLSGKTGGLFFLRKDLKKQYIQNNHREYIMDGACPHGMENDIDESKYTFCMGDPWNIAESSLDNLPIDKHSVIELNKPDLKSVEKFFKIGKLNV